MGEKRIWTPVRVTPTILLDSRRIKVRFMELLSNLSLSRFLSRFYLFVMDQIVIESLYYRFQAGVVRHETQDSTNQNALFVEWFSRLGSAFFRVVHDEIFALFQACVGNFGTIPPRKVVGTLYLDSSYVTFKYFAFLSVCDKFELLGDRQFKLLYFRNKTCYGNGNLYKDLLFVYLQPSVNKNS